MTSTEQRDSRRSAYYQAGILAGQAERLRRLRAAVETHDEAVKAAITGVVDGGPIGMRTERRIRQTIDRANLRGRRLSNRSLAQRNTRAGMFGLRR